jgi:hypothetical protein
MEAFRTEHIVDTVIAGLESLTILDDDSTAPSEQITSSPSLV